MHFVTYLMHYVLARFIYAGAGALVPLLVVVALIFVLWRSGARR
jgi:hypothetical protein